MCRQALVAECNTNPVEHRCRHIFSGVTEMKRQRTADSDPEPVSTSSSSSSSSSSCSDLKRLTLIRLPDDVLNSCMGFFSANDLYGFSHSSTQGQTLVQHYLKGEPNLHLHMQSTDDGQVDGGGMLSWFALNHMLDYPQTVQRFTFLIDPALWQITWAAGDGNDRQIRIKRQFIGGLIKLIGRNAQTLRMFETDIVHRPSPSLTPANKWYDRDTASKFFVAFTSCALLERWDFNRMPHRGNVACPELVDLVTRLSWMCCLDLHLVPDADDAGGDDADDEEKKTFGTTALNARVLSAPLPQLTDLILEDLMPSMFAWLTPLLTPLLPQLAALELMFFTESKQQNIDVVDFLHGVFRGVTPALKYLRIDAWLPVKESRRLLAGSELAKLNNGLTRLELHDMKVDSEVLITLCLTLSKLESLQLMSTGPRLSNVCRQKLSPAVLAHLGSHGLPMDSMTRLRLPAVPVRFLRCLRARNLTSLDLGERRFGIETLRPWNGQMPRLPLWGLLNSTCERLISLKISSRFVIEEPLRNRLCGLTEIVIPNVITCMPSFEHLLLASPRVTTLHLQVARQDLSRLFSTLPQSVRHLYIRVFNTHNPFGSTPPQTIDADLALLLKRLPHLTTGCVELSRVISLFDVSATSERLQEADDRAAVAQFRSVMAQSPEIDTSRLSVTCRSDRNTRLELHS